MLYDNINFANGNSLQSKLVLTGTLFPEAEDGTLFLNSETFALFCKVNGAWREITRKDTEEVEIVLTHNGEFDSGEYYQLNYPALSDLSVNTSGVFKSISSSPSDSSFTVMVNGEDAGEIDFKANMQTGEFIGPETLILEAGDILSIGTPTQAFVHGMVIFGFKAHRTAS